MRMTNKEFRGKRLLVALCVGLLIGPAGCARRAGKDSIGVSTNAPAANPGQPVRVSPVDADGAEPTVATTRDGTAYVAWVEHRGKEADVMLARVNQDGQPRGVPVRVNPKAGEATAWHGDPPTLAVATEGTLYVGWTARVESAGGHANDLYLSASRDGGQTFAPPVKVNDDRKAGVHAMHSLAVSNDGRIYLAWLDERSGKPPSESQEGVEHRRMEGNREVFFSYSIDGGRTFSTNQRVASDVCPCCKTSLAVARDGRVYASWRQVLPGDYRHIGVSSSTDGGKTFSHPVIASDDRWTISGCPVSGSALLAGAGGTLRVLWYTAGEAGQPGLYWSESHDGGKTFAPRKLLAGGPAHGTPVLVPDGGDGLAAVWEDSENGIPRVVTARFDDNSQGGDAMTLSGDGELPAAAATADHLFVAYVAKNGEGRGIWVVTARKEKLSAKAG